VVPEAWLAYQTAEGSPHIRLIRTDGTGDHELVEGSHPDWSPDGEWVAYEVDGADIWIIRTDGTDARRIFDCEAPCVIGDSPAWSPDGTEIAFTTAEAIDGKAPTATITAVNVETGGLRTLVETTGPDYPFYPRWAPDGKRLVISIQRFGSTRTDDCTPIGAAIAVVVAGSGLRPQLLTEFSMFADYPDWSTRGSIVFTTYDLGAREAGCAPDASKPSDIYTINPDGTDQRQLTRNTAGLTLIRPFDDSLPGTASGPLSAQPTWAPDGLSIIFTRVDGPTWPGTEPWAMTTRGTFPGPAVRYGGVIGEHPRLQPLDGAAGIDVDRNAMGAGRVIAQTAPKQIERYSPDELRCRVLGPFTSTDGGPGGVWSCLTGEVRR
jgi:Tol biopolymer transport system component